jgi:hypothetical protein
MQAGALGDAHSMPSESRLPLKEPIINKQIALVYTDICTSPIALSNSNRMAIMAQQQLRLRLDCCE